MEKSPVDFTLQSTWVASVSEREREREREGERGKRQETGVRRKGSGVRM